MEKYFEIVLIKSLIGQKKKHKLILKSLGLNKINQIVKKGNNPLILGMLRKVSHLIKFKTV